MLTKEKGITCTSANYLCNLAKELIKEISFDGLSFVDHHIELINGEKKILNHGFKDLEKIEEYLERQGELMAFCAYFREAIKAHENNLETVRGKSFIEYCSEMNIPYPSRVSENLKSTEDILKSWNIKEREHYYHIEALAATYGKHVHPNGNISVARDQYLEKLNKPCSVTGSGRDLIINTYNPSTDGVNECFVKLQTKQRMYEKELNRLKSQLKKELLKVNNEILSKNQELEEKYESEYSILYSDYQIWKNNKVEEAATMKLVVPEKLQKTLDYLNEK